MHSTQSDTTYTARQQEDLHKEKALKGDPQAQFDLAQCYELKGQRAEAEHWYRASAQFGHKQAIQKVIGLLPRKEEATEHKPLSAESEYQKGLAYENGNGVEKDSKAAINHYLKAAEQGHRNAQSRLAFCYEKEQKNLEAAQWYLKAAKQGDPTSQGKLVVFYQLGIGFEKNHEEAIRWAEQQGQQDVFDNSLLVADHYASQPSTQDSEKKAAAWYEKAAEQGNTKAQIKLAECYEHGRGVPKDVGTATLLYAKAAQSGNPEAQYKLALLYIQNNEYTLALPLLLQAAAQNSPPAQRLLGIMYDEGTGVPKDQKEALAWYEKASKNNDTEAEYRLGTHYYHDQDTAQDIIRALELVTNAAKKGHIQAQFIAGMIHLEHSQQIKADAFKKCLDETLNQTAYWLCRFVEGTEDQPRDDNQRARALFGLGACYHKGRSVPQDDKIALEYYLQAAQRGHPRAQNRVGIFFNEGRGAPQDATQALYWYTRSAKQGFHNAQYRLGDLYSTGALEEKMQALDWYLKSAQQRNPVAQYKLGLIYEFGQLGGTRLPDVEVDMQEALLWYRKAAQEDYDDARAAASRLQRLGVGCGQKENEFDRLTVGGLNYPSLRRKRKRSETPTTPAITARL